MDKIQVRKGDWVGTTLVVLGAAAGAFLAFGAVACRYRELHSVASATDPNAHGQVVRHAPDLILVEPQIEGLTTDGRK